MFTSVTSRRNPAQNSSSLSVEKRRFLDQKSKNKGSSLNKSQQLKPFCKICFDTGKLEQIYNSHFVRETRDPNSRIICPTLLAMECRYCFLKGHTVSKCPKLAMAPSVTDAPMKQKKIVKCCDETASCSSNGFSTLYSSDNEDEEDTLNKREQLIVTSTPPVKRSYAAVAMLASEEDDLSCVTVSVCSSLKEVKKNLYFGYDDLISADTAPIKSLEKLGEFVVLQPSGMRNTITHVNKYKNRSWADDSDSDEE
jgi:hypothetical protein